jgi:hypothetical protein
MYTACTLRLARAANLELLSPIPRGFVWIALGAWALAFAGMMRHIVRQLLPTPR